MGINETTFTAVPWHCVTFGSKERLGKIYTTSRSAPFFVLFLLFVLRVTILFSSLLMCHVFSQSLHTNVSTPALSSDVTETVLVYYKTQQFDVPVRTVTWYRERDTKWRQSSAWISSPEPIWRFWLWRNSFDTAGSGAHARAVTVPTAQVCPLRVHICPCPVMHVWGWRIVQAILRTAFSDFTAPGIDFWIICG